MTSFGKLMSSVLLAAVLVFVGLTPHPTSAKEQTTLKVLPETIEGETIYPSSFFRVSVPWTHRLTLEKLSLPADWVGKGYYFQLWDGENQPLPSFKPAKRLDQADLKVFHDLNVDSLNTFRFVMFVAKDSQTQPDISALKPGQILVTYALGPDARLIGIVVLLALFFVGLILLTTRTSRSLGASMQQIVLHPCDLSGLHSLPHALAALWLILAGSSLFGMVVGWFTGGIQIFYVLVKLPFLMLGSLAISFLTIAILSALVSKQLGFRLIAGLSLRVLALVSMVLVGLAFPLYFFITQGFSHNATLLMTLFCAGMGGLVGLWALYRCLSGVVSATLARLLSVGWFVIFGVVGLQLGWLFRPWVGWIDHVSGTVPFMRLYSGNVFEAIFKLIF